jgi:Retinoblastoma-associated protein B domain/Retinoblastoma-associated protein A domain
VCWSLPGGVLLWWIQKTMESSDRGQSAASSSNKLPTSVRDACLKTMRLLNGSGPSTGAATAGANNNNKEHNASVKVLFDALYTWTHDAHQTKDEPLSVGTIVALALVYTRLIDAYGQRKKQPTSTSTTTMTNTTANRAAAAASGTGATAATAAAAVAAAPTSSAATSEAAEAMKKKEQEVQRRKKAAATLAAAKKAAAALYHASTTTATTSLSSSTPTPTAPAQTATILPSKLDLSPKVSDAVREMANDLHAVHALLGRMMMAGTSGSSGSGGSSGPAVAASSTTTTTTTTAAASSTATSVTSTTAAAAAKAAAAAASTHGTRSKSQPKGSSKDGGEATGSKKSSSSSATTTVTNAWQDWNVVHVCILARDKIQNATAMANLSRTVPTLRSLSDTAVRVYVTFASMVLDYLAAKVVRSMESYRDFLYLWHHSLTTTTSDDGDSRSEGSNDATNVLRRRPRLHVAYNDHDAGHNDNELDKTIAVHSKKTSSNKNNKIIHPGTPHLQLAAHWEPYVPGMNKGGAAGKRKKNPTAAPATATTAAVTGDSVPAAGTDNAAAVEPAAETSTTATAEATTTDDITQAIPPLSASSKSIVPPHDLTLFRVKTVAWTLAVDRSMHEQQNHPDQRVPSRRQRLVASCASLALVVGLAALCQYEDPKGGIVDTAPTTSATEGGAEVDADADAGAGAGAVTLEEPDAKKRKNNDGQAVVAATDAAPAHAAILPERMDAFLDQLIIAANQEAAFTRWACLGDRWKIPNDIKRQEVLDDLLIVAKGLWNRLSFEKKNTPTLSSPPAPATTTTATTPRAEALPAWLSALNKAVDGKPLVLSWHLPWLVALVHDTRLRALRQRKVRVEAAAFFKESVLAKEVNMRAWCTVISNRPVTGVDPGMFIGEGAGLTRTATTTTTTTGTAASKSTPLTASAKKKEKEMAEVAKRENIVGVVAVAAEPTGTIPVVAKRVEDEIAALAKSSINATNSSFFTAVQSMRRSVTPSVITEAMEMNEWAVSVLYMDVVRPNPILLEYFKAACRDQSKGWQSLIIPTINKALLLLSQENLTDKTTRKAPVSLTQKGEQTGLVVAHGEMSHDKALCKAVVAVYYHALEAILYLESKRLSKESHPRLVLNQSFHRALLVCCCSVVLKAIGATHKLRPSPNFQTIQIYNILHVCESNPMDFLKVSGSFLTAMTTEDAKVESPLLLLPRFLQKDFRRTEQSVLDSLLWARDPKFEEPFPDKIEDLAERTAKRKNSTPTSFGGGTGWTETDEPCCWWPVPELAPTMPEEILDYGQPEKKRYPTPQINNYAEFKTVSSLIHRVMEQAYGRIEKLCRALDVPLQTSLVTHVWVAFRYLLRNRVDLFFDRHVDHWILTSIYGVARKMKYNDITFARIIDAYVATRSPELGDVTCQRIIRHIKINMTDSEGSQLGNVIVLYNKIFVPVMKEHLLKSESLKRAAERLVAVEEGHAVKTDATANDGEPTMVRVTVHSNQALEKQSSLYGAPQAIIRFGDPSSKQIEDANVVLGNDSPDVFV